MLGIFTDKRLEQHIKAHEPISVNPFGNTIDLRLEQEENADSPSSLKLAGRTTTERHSHAATPEKGTVRMLRFLGCLRYLECR